MMPDLVNQYMANDPPQRLVVFGPVIQDGAPVEPDQIGEPCDVAMALMRKARALKQAEQVEFAFRAHFVEHFFRGEVLDPDDDPLAQVEECLWQPREGVVRHGLHFGKRRCFG